MKVPAADLAAGSMALTSLARGPRRARAGMRPLAEAAEQRYEIHWHGYTGSRAELKAHPGEYITTVIGNKGIKGQAGLVSVDATQTVRAASAIDPYMLYDERGQSAGVEAELKDIKETARHILELPGGRTSAPPCGAT